MPYYRAELGGNPPYEEGQGLDLTDSTLSLNAASTSEYGGAKVDGETIGINSQGQLFALQEQTITLSATTSSVVIGDTDTITATASGGGTISATSNDTDIATVSVSNGEITITGVSAGNITITVTASSVGQYGPAEAVINVEVTAVHIYGAEWDGSSSPAWTRTDDAVSFADPNPYYSGMSSTPSSPFDNIMPWSGMRIVEDSSAGTLVEIPKFYYKWTRNGNAMKLQISMTQEDGFLCSPAHADRNDGIGERDYVYIGRYHCASDYKSKTGTVPKGSTTLDSFMVNVSNLGNNVYVNDYAIRWTIYLLCLVEYANWNISAKIGGGGDNSANTVTMGYTDLMPYHTGTTQVSRESYGFGAQYRYIEGLWENVSDFVSGIYMLSDYPNYNVYMIKNPVDYVNWNNATYVTTTPKYSGYIQGWRTPSASFNYALFPNNLGGSSTTYTCSGYVPSAGDSSNKSYLYCSSDSPGGNIFNMYFKRSSDGGAWYLGSRLMVLPPSRLSPPSP